MKTPKHFLATEKILVKKFIKVWKTTPLLLPDCATDVQ